MRSSKVASNREIHSKLIDCLHLNFSYITSKIQYYLVEIPMIHEERVLLLVLSGCR
jgi:hypothetical protein